MRFRAGLWVLFAALSGAMSMTANAADNQIESAVVAGQVKRIWSVTLNEERRLLIRLPDHYAQSNRSYPVLYLLDAD
ncbi:alpha/beta hydrolase-fold protein, partial [Steroidobacter sp.]|uniref:alpha/beta hydrolase-fold protein n=1 Tax=Steroidobacter sp. TaxID=1978227 RepID=UPI001A3AD971